MFNNKEQKKVYIYTFSHCRRRNIDACHMAEYFKRNGWQITKDVKEADLLICNSCAYIKETENISIRKIRLMKRKMRKNVQLIIGGCLPLINKQRLETVFKGPTFGPDSLEKLDEIINAKVRMREVSEPNILDMSQFNVETNFEKFILNFELSIAFLFKIVEAIFKSIFEKLRVKNKILFTSVNYQPIEIDHCDKNAFWIRLSWGCTSACAYCIERFATRSIHSKPLEEIISTFKKGLGEGYKKFYFIATDCGAYGQDIDLNICDLLKEIFKIDGDYKISILDFHPKWLLKYFDTLKQLLRENQDKIDYINFPIQSGSEKILKLMNREYTIEELKPKLIELRKEILALKLITHIIVGFPQETEKDFRDSLNIIKDLKFDGIFINKCTIGLDTQAALMPKKVPMLIKDIRLLRACLFFKKVLLGSKND